MSSEEVKRERCPRCDRPMVDPARAHDIDEDAWLECERNAVDWRARALAAEALLVEIFPGGDSCICHLGDPGTKCWTCRRDEHLATHRKDAP